MMRPNHLFMMRMRIELLLVASAFSCGLIAQSPEWRAEVPAVEKAGFYVIALSPELLGASRADFGDIRLLDMDGNDVPYVLNEVSTPEDEGLFIPYQLIRDEVLEHGTVLELERPSGQELEELHIWIRPIETEKSIRITGSDDRSEWFMVKDEHLVAQGARGDPPHQVLTVRLPRNDYRFLRLALNDSLTPPMNVLGVGRFTDGAARAWRYAETAPLSFVQTDTARESRLHLALDAPLLAERLAFEVADTGFFRRDARVEAHRRGTMKKGTHAAPLHWAERLVNSVIASDRAACIDMAPTRLDTFDLVVSNGDDRPLRFVTLRVLARQRVLLANLQPDKRYHLATGDPALEAPRYDIAHFADKLPPPVDTLSHSALKATPLNTDGSVGFDPAAWWVWAAIVVLALGMGAVAVSLLRREG